MLRVSGLPHALKHRMMALAFFLEEINVFFTLPIH